MVFNTAPFVVVALAAVIVWLPSIHVASSQDDKWRGTRTASINRGNRDLAILQRPPWNYNPGSPGTGCVNPNAYFDSDVVVSFQGDASNLDSNTFMELEDAFLESYNQLRRGLCDDDSRQITEVAADENSISIKSFDEFSIRFLVGVGCDRCSMDTTLFEPEPARRRRMREDKDAIFHQEKGDNRVNSTESRHLAVYRRPYQATRGVSPPTPRATAPPVPITVAPPPPTPPPPTPSPAVLTVPEDEDCCPANGERRAPYASEFTTAFDSTYKALTIGNRVLQEDPIQLILEAIELASITCDEPLGNLNQKCL